ncbi:MAG TPA: ATP-binding protein [Flavipsychrobacter sp.]
MQLKLFRDHPGSIILSLSFGMVLCLVAFVSVVMLSGCSAKNEYAEPRTFAYVDSADIRLHYIRIEQGYGAGVKYLDSLRGVYYNKSLRDKFNILYLYFDHNSRSGRKARAQIYVDSAISLLENNDKRHFSIYNYTTAYYDKADMSYILGDINTAYEYYYKALSLSKKIDDKCSITYYNLRMGIIVFRNEHYKDAIPYFQKALQYNKACATRFMQHYRTQQLLNNIGLSYERLGNFDSAVVYYHNALKEVNHLKSSNPVTTHALLNIAAAVIKGNMGGVYARLGNVDTAEELMKESISVCEVNGNEPIDAQYTRLKLANMYLSTGRLPEAKQLLQRVAKIGDTLPDLSVKARWYKSMSEYASLTGDYRNAYTYYVQFKQHQDSVLAFRNTFSMANIDGYVQNLDNQNEITILKESANKRKLYLAIVIGLSFFGVLTTGTVVNNWRKSRRHVNELTEVNESMNRQKAQLTDALSELEKIAEEKDRILKAVSHDMRSPINSSLALADILLSDSANLTAEQKEYLALLKISNENALGLTKDLLEIATLNTERLEKSPVDITNLVKDQLHLLGFKAAEKGQKLNFVAPENHITASVNAEKIARVLSNLVTNAIKFSPQNSEINVSLHSDDQTFTLEVKDKGIGIPDTMKDKVFDLFSDAKRFGTSGEQPFGLGLSISRQITDAHSGKIWFDSVQNEGTTFYVRMPLV